MVDLHGEKRRLRDGSVYFLAFPPFPNALPSKPGRDLPFAPLCFSFLFSFLLAMLSARFFCFAAIFDESCSLRSALIKRENGLSYNNKRTLPRLFAFRLLLLVSLDRLLQACLIVGHLNSIHPCRSLFPFLAFLNLLALFVR